MANEEILIRTANHGDLDTILGFYQLLFHQEVASDPTLKVDFPESMEGRRHFQHHLESDDEIIFTVELMQGNAQEGIRGPIIGYLIGRVMSAVSSRIEERIGELESMLVLPEFRSRGIGTQLIDKFANWARARGASRMRVMAPHQNRRAIEFFRNYQFAEYEVVLERGI